MLVAKTDHIERFRSRLSECGLSIARYRVTGTLFASLDSCVLSFVDVELTAAT